ncbi:carboxymuconolactone decarboxylase family protein [Paenibacillus sp. N4]|uniref:carboxymuconolactone decarboxylase family protein n=1 Tax=Paenibacillus vietnamensis TaxID=2590547 RepID=UPI001CD175AD|nr:carboxymuconolactone decarboxylase family protein [Paenibacillus vietnamensis]MCA0757851.1 carboxymuconolactone decarboxylase family protein [Paenibacillus vietnamensis]
MSTNHSSSLYDRKNLARVPELSKLVPEGSKAFFQFMGEAFSEKAISSRTKELIAVAVTHVTGCPYCIDVHTGKFKKLEGSPEEIVEAILVAGAVNAETVLYHSVNSWNSFHEKADGELYRLDNLELMELVEDMKPEAFEAFGQFQASAMASGAIDSKTKELIAVVISHVNGCAYSIEVHTKKFKQLGGTQEELVEGLLVGGVANAGYVLTHGINALNAYDFEAAPSR